MFLTGEEERILEGEEGETRMKMMEILVALGKVFGAERMVPVRSVQVSGASYKTIGEYGLSWLRSLDSTVAVPTMLNPVGMDRSRWREMGIDPGFAAKQEEVIEAYRRLGVRLECTCTPYYLHLIHYGDHLAWSESSAVAYANSVVGARTNREGGPSALAAAIVGRTPEYGLHLVAVRAPQLAIRVETDGHELETAHYGALGYRVGSIAGNRIPIFSGIRPTRDQLKTLGAAMAASGAVALFHVEGITPEARIFTYDTRSLETIPVVWEEITDVFQDAPVDAVALGCPHCSEQELSRIASLLEGKTVRIPLYVFAARGVMEKQKPLVAAIEKSGARVFADTCMVVSPAMERFGTIMVNSGKAFSYVPNMCGAAVRLGTTEECIRVATGAP
ncbi:putative aconitase [Methanolinea mesophila]|uniref:aconitase X n=1 Tax=Methanolinea mesophila TaxID=547055 RepID=UPI001AE79285|nr:aconitase X catalytic domain-containing protein [Methanolinea mesophila]MBP1928742.1 putative aconitase [Methanolinea mesophila]